MALSYAAFVATSGQRDFDISFPYINRSHVQVLVNGDAVPVLEWVNPTRLRLVTPLAGGESVFIQRDTPINEALVKFQDGNVLTKEDLNTAVQQSLYKQQELAELYDRSLKDAQQRLADNLGVVTDPENVADELAQLVIEKDVLANFNTRIADIDLNASSVTQVAADLTGLQTEVTDLGNLIDQLSNPDGSGVYTAIENEQSERIAGDTALSQTIALIGSVSGDSTSFIIDVDTAKVSEGQSLGQRLSLIDADVAANSAAIATEQTARADADSAIASDVTALVARVGTAEGDIADNAAAIVSEASARASAIDAEAQARTALAARVGDAEAAILSEQTARASADSSFASQISLLQTEVDGNAVAILSEQTARANADSALASDLSGLQATVDANSAAIVSEQTARANADSALASDISVLSTTVGNNTASVSTLQSSVNGLEAKYGVSLDVNGHVTGFVQNNDGTTGDFTIVADRFAIVDPANDANTAVPFEVSGGIVRIKEAAIGDLTVNKLTDGTMSANITQDGDLTMGTGRIVFDNGTYMKVAGVGFGSANQFIEWFGPKMAISSCTEANAIQFLKTNGDAYFGGTLSAGILKNAATSTSTAADASITVGPFGSNGNPIQVVTSYSVNSTSLANYTTSQTSAWDTACSSWGATPDTSDPTLIIVDETKGISCTVTIPITRNGAAFGTLSLTGGTERLEGVRPSTFEGTNGYLRYTRTVVGSITGTDNFGGTTNRTFVATISTRTGATVGSITSQKLSIVATEE